METSLPFPECFAGLAGDFDGQGLSFGVLQWSLGQGTLQPLLGKLAETHGALLQEIFSPYYGELLRMLRAERSEQREWARSIQDLSQFRLAQPWRGFFKALGRRPECQQVQAEFARQPHRTALSLCKAYRVWSERAVALFFDIQVQNGGISSLVKAQIEADFERLKPSPRRADVEVARLRIIARRRAAAANPRWRADVRVRKLTIANGEGVVHGCYYHLERQFGIRLKTFREA
jgi:hypothetical protein